MKNILSASMIIGVSLSLTACSWDLGLDSDSSSSSTGYYQFVNLVAQSPTIQIEIEDDEDALVELAYGEASELESVSKGTYDLTFNQILPNSENDEFISDDSVSVSKNKTSTYIMYGDTEAPAFLTLNTDISDLFDEDFDEDFDAIIQFAHLSDSAGDVDVYWLNEGDDLLNQVADYTLSYESSSDEVEIEAGTYKVVFTESTTDTIIASADSITITEGDAQIFVLSSYLIAGSDDAVSSVVQIETDAARILTNEAQAASIRFSHGVSDPEYSDIYLDVFLTGSDDADEQLASALEFGTLSDSVELDIEDADSGDTRYFYLKDNTTEDTIDTFSVDLQPSSRLLILTSGDTSSAITVNDNEEDLRVIDTHAKLLVSHSIKDIKSDGIEVIITSDGGNPDSYIAQVELSYMNNDEYELESGDYDIYIYNADSGELIIETTLRGVESGDVINLIATDYVYGGTPYQLQTHFNN